MPKLLKLPPKILLHVAGYLTKPSDCLALSLTCRELQVIGEQQLYSNVTLRSKHDAATDNRVEMLYRCLTSFEPRCEWVRSLSVTLVHPPTPRDLERLTAVVRLLSCLDSLELEYSSTARNVKAIDLRPLLKVCSMSPKSSLRRFVWRNLVTLGETFVSFLRFHRGLQHLEFNFEVPKIGIEILPNIEVLRAPIATVLQLLPGRQIRRVKTTISNNTSTVWMGMSFLDMEKIQTFSSTVYGGDEGVERHESLVQQLGCLEFLEIQDETVITSMTLRFTNIKFLRLRKLRGSFSLRQFFTVVPTLECIEVQPNSMLPIGRVSVRWYRGERRPRLVSWNCKRNEEWLHDWKMVVEHEYPAART